MIDDILSLERRSFLQLSAAAVALATAGTAVNAVPSTTGQRALVVYQPTDNASVEFATAMQASGLPIRALGSDPVRLWRDELQALVVEQGCRLLGRTGWMDYFVLSSLAREHRIFPQHEQQLSADSFDWLI